MKTDPTFYPSGTAFQVCRFFANNPEEELRTDDVAIKFDVVRKGVPVLLKPAIDAGYVARRLLSGNPRIAYIAGPKLGQFVDLHA